MPQRDRCDEMSQPSAPDSILGSNASNAVGVLGNSFTTGAVLATEQTRSITTAATGLKNEVENNVISINYIRCEGDYNHSVQGATNTNSQDRGDERPLASPSPSPSKSKSFSDSTGLLPSPTALLGPGLSDSLLPDLSSPSTYVYDLPSRPDSVAIPEWASHFQNLDAKVTDTYVYVLGQVDAKRARRSGEQRKTFKFEVNVQKNIFVGAITSLIDTLNKMSLATEQLGAETKSLCEKACQILDDVWVQLQNVRVSVETFRKAETKDKKKKRDLADSFATLRSRLDAFEDVAFSMVPADPIPDLSTSRANAQDTALEFREVDRLSTEGRVSSMLHQCLCRACPEQCHDRHTTYLSLQPEEIGTASIPSPSELVRVIWQCHMAFQSTIAKDPFIWLRVVSSAAGATETDFTEVGSDCKDRSKAPFQEISAEAITGNSRKRRATSTPLEPSPKAQKTRPGQNVRRISQPGPRLTTPSRFEVCPELLAQHDLDTVVMNLIDDYGHNHNIFYLPKEKRPTNEAEGDPISLSEILDKRHSRHAKRRMGRKSVLQLSRLIAEAVLRFDLRDSDPSPEQSVVFYKSPRNRLIPFLKKVIRKSVHAPTAVEEEEDSSSSRRSVLLANLGHIMLQLGLMKEERVREDPPQDLSGRRNYIQRVAPEVVTEMGPRYHQVILQCVSLSALGGDSAATFEIGFKQKYYHSIVKPLKDMEEFLEKHGKK